MRWRDAREFYRTRDGDFVGVLSPPARGSQRCYVITAVMEEDAFPIFIPAVMPYRRLRKQAQRVDARDVPEIIRIGIEHGWAQWHPLWEQ